MEERFLSFTISRGFRNFFKKSLLIFAFFLAVILLIRVVTGVVTGYNLAKTVKRLETKWKSLHPSSLAPPEVPDSKNAAKFYKAALELLFLDEEDGDVFKILSAKDPVKALEEQSRLDSILQKNQIALDLIGRGADYPLSDWEVPYKDGIEAEFPKLLPIIKLSRILTLKALIAVSENDPEQAVKTLMTGFSFSGSLKNEPLLLVQLIRISMNRNFSLAVKEMLARNEPSDADLLRLQEIIETSNTPDPIRQGFLEELKGMYLFHNKIENGTYLVSEDQQSFLMLKALATWLLLPVARSDTNFYIDHMDQFIEYSDLPRFRRALKHKKSPAEDKPYFFQITSRMLLHNNESPVMRGDFARARCSIAALAIALRRFRIANGRYPDNPEALVPSFISEVPIDPFSGKPFFYAREGEGFLLQSEGEDPKYTDAPVKRDKILKWKIEK